MEPQTADTKLQIALDLGSTTLVGYLCASDKGKFSGDPKELLSYINDHILETKDLSNPQIKYGADILSRVSFASGSPENAKMLADSLGYAIIDLIDDLLDVYNRKISGNKISSYSLLDTVVLVGNPVIMGSIRSFDIKGNLKKDTDSKIISLPAIGDYVGADALSGAYLLTRLIEGDKKTDGSLKNVILIDIGTNAEVILLSEDKRVSTSAAAGPAFEGGNISCGVRAIPGAIDKVVLTASVSAPSGLLLHTIDEQPPVGICGSGLLSLLRILLDCGVIDNTGYLRSKNEALKQKCPARTAGAIIDDNTRDDSRNNKRYFRLTERISIDQDDIHKIMLASSAIHTAVEMLIKECGLTEADIDAYYLGGAFGNYITVESVLDMNILPKSAAGKIVQYGNTAGIGACLCAICPDLITDVISLKNSILTVKLAQKKEFNDLFIENMTIGKDAGYVDRR